MELGALVVAALDGAALAPGLGLARLPAELADLLHRSLEVVDLEDDLGMSGRLRTPEIPPGGVVLVIWLPSAWLPGPNSQSSSSP
jgi:hypothetical protein